MSYKYLQQIQEASKGLNLKKQDFYFRTIRLVLQKQPVHLQLKQMKLQLMQIMQFEELMSYT